MKCPVCEKKCCREWDTHKGVWVWRCLRCFTVARKCTDEELKGLYSKPKE